MSAAEKLVTEMTRWAETLSEEERSLLTQILARSALQAEAQDGGGREPMAAPRLRLASVHLPELILACVGATDQSAARHGIKQVNSSDMPTPGNLGKVWECWRALKPG